MIDLVDGKLPADREQAVLAALRAEPRLALLVRQLRDDEAGLAMLRDVRVPADLGDRIESALQTQALRDLAAQEADAPAEVATTSVVTVRQSGGGWRMVLESAWAGRLATAASIAIVAGVGYLGYGEYQRAMQRPGLGVANSGNPTTPIVPEVVRPAEVEVAAGPGNAETTPEGPEPGATVVAAAEALTPERAIAMARQGRLVISVRLPSAGAGAMKRVEGIARAAGREGGWRPMAMDQLPPAYAGLLTPSIAVPNGGTPARPGLPTLAGDGSLGGGGTASDPRPTVRPVGPVRGVVLAVYSVEIAPRGATLAGLLDALSPGRPEGAVLRVMEAPMLPPLAATPEDVLWWQNPPASWGQRVRVPVVVEGLE